jgi:GNAT superfamily N-acetyltransferase
VIGCTLRPARLEDADAVVPLLHESSRGLLDYSFAFADADASAFLRHAYESGRGLFGYQQQLVAVDDDGRIVLTLTAYPGRTARRWVRETLDLAFRYFGGRRFLAVLWRQLAMAPLFIAPSADSLFLANICTLPDRRGQGVFTQIFPALEERARTAGLAALELDVSFANQAARRLYQRLGFVVTVEKPYHGKRALDGFRRMRHRLDPAR